MLDGEHLRDVQPRAERIATRDLVRKRDLTTLYPLTLTGGMLA